MKPVLVVGAGRCGSSAMANILRHLGVFMGERFAPADAQNPRGFWEDLDFKETNQAFINRDIDYDEFAVAIRTLVEMRNEQHICWGFKDPRISQVLPIYRRVLLPDASYIWMDRDPQDIQWSMFRAYPHANAGNQPWLAYQVWLVRHGMLEQWLPKDSLRVSFDEMLAYPANIIKDVVRYVKPHGVTDEKINRAVQSIKHREETPDGLGAPRLSEVTG